MLFYEMIHESRIVPLDGRPHADKKIKQWWGDAKGRWDGDTLVVETTNFSPKESFEGSSENMRLVLGFLRTGPDTIDYPFTVDDPTIWTKPFTANRPQSRLLTTSCAQWAFSGGTSPPRGVRASQTALAGRAGCGRTLATSQYFISDLCTGISGRAVRYHSRLCTRCSWSRRRCCARA